MYPSYRGHFCRGNRNLVRGTRMSKFKAQMSNQIQSTKLEIFLDFDLDLSFGFGHLSFSPCGRGILCSLQRYKSIMDALGCCAEERRSWQRYSSGRSQHPAIRRFLNGETHPFIGYCTGKMVERSRYQCEGHHLN